ncbi:MAG: hypothetical protein L3K08_02240 [Thermoplasmata archaeon]|nr:hypothetical protein [Thermoplasmata archaeon]
MIEPEAREFAAILRRNGIGFVFVGGVAIGQRFPSVTKDSDVMVVPKEYARAVEAIDRDPAVVAMSPGPAEMPGGHVLVRGALVRFALLDPAAYSGDRHGEDFYDFVHRYRSDVSSVGRVARPEVVWYMRLVIDQWEVYVSKILRDLRAGAPWSISTKVDHIAKRFGVRPLVRSRLKHLWEDARIVGLLPDSQ